MSLVLAPSGTQEKEKQLKINPFVSRQETGPIVPKTYDVSLVALGFKTLPDHITLDVKAGQITDARFTLIPRGMVANLMYATTAAVDSFWGFYKELPEKVKIRSIALTGPGVSRILAPVEKMTDREVLAAFLASRDFAYKNYFAFFDLQAGDYDLTITADGCEPFKTRVKATPGEFVPTVPLRLILK
jgi:hypothetical protein